MSFLDCVSLNLHNSLKRYDMALNYLKSRNVTDEEIERFNIGYTKIFGLPDISGEDRDSFIKDTYRGQKLAQKIVFPLYNYLGNVVGLFGRAIDSKEFKYYLSPEAKYTGALFGLLQALPYIYETGRVYVVEGPFDLLALNKVCKNSVAAMTAGISEAQYNLLSLIATEIITVFDSDGPGQYGANLALELWSSDAFRENNHFNPKENGLAVVSNLQLGTYKDPDQCFKVLGLKEFEIYIKKLINGLSFKGFL